MLVVAGHAPARAVLRAILDPTFARVEVATVERDLIREGRLSRYDAICVDVDDDPGPGLACLRALRRAGVEGPAILVGAGGLALGPGVDLPALDVHAVLEKPYGLEAMTELVMGVAGLRVAS